MTQRNLLRTAIIVAVTVWFGIFAFLSLRPATDSGALPTRAVLPTSVAAAASPTQAAPTATPMLTATAVQSLPANQPLPTLTTAPTSESNPTEAPDAQDESASPAEPAVIEDQIVVQFAPDATAAERAAHIAAIGGTVKSEIRALDTVVVTVPDASAAQVTSAAVLTSEPDYYVYALYDFNNPLSDPLAGQQWALGPTGVQAVWNDVPETTVTVAVLDSGICASHPDLVGRVLNGWDYVGNDSNPNDVYGHGCGVSSVIAANIDNSTGMAGIAPNAMILPLRVLDASGSGSYSDVAQAIIDAADQGADVINLSLGGPAASTLLHNAVKYAVSKGVIVIAAAGNDGDNGALYPAAYSEVISVGALDQNLNRASFSNYGSQIDVWAPGASILTAYINDGYAMQNGTSFAAPIVSGIAAMEIALGRDLDLSGDVINIAPVEEVVQVPSETPTATATEPPATTPTTRDGAPEGMTAAEPPTPSDLWAVRLTPGSDPQTVAAELGFQYLRPVGALANTYLFLLPGSAEQQAVAASAANVLDSSPLVETSQQQFFYIAETRNVPSEPGLSAQWHLDNTGQSGGTAGMDANVFAAWQIPLGGGDYVDGEGVVIAVVDDGLQHTHPSLLPNYLPSASYDLQSDDPDPSPRAGYGHGTSVAGVAAGPVDGSCGVGAAYAANLSGLRLIDGGISDVMVADSQKYAYNTNDIYNNSWGFTLMVNPTDFWLTADAFAFGAENGRGGLGNIYVWASGNDLRVYSAYYGAYLYYGYNVNNDWPANSRYTIAVGAINHNGIQSYYSTPGSALVVSAPSSGSQSGIYTTDLVGADGYDSGNCTNGFGGTSSASPLVAGVVGLMLEANPNLGWRDVQHILAETSVQVDPSNQGESSNWTTNGAGYTHSDAYGFGMIDAEAAVNAALTWENVVPEMAVTTTTSVVSQDIPDGYGSHNFWGDASGASYGAAVTDTLNVPENIIVEHVEVTFDADIRYREQLYVTLTSPDGTESILTNPHFYNAPDDPDHPEWLADYQDWPFMTVRNWGESSQGNWTISVRDGYAGTTGTFNSWSLKIYGRIPAPTDLTAAAMAQDQIDLTWAYDGLSSVDLVLESSDDGVNWTQSQTLAHDATSYSYTVPACDRTYYFRLRSEHPASSAYSPYTAVVDVLCDPVDHLTGAQDLGSTAPATASYDTTGFSPGSDPVPSCGTQPNRTIWYTFTPSESGNYRLDTTGSAINTVLSIWVDDGGMSEIACDNDSGPGDAASIVRSLEAGTTYYLTVAGTQNTGGEIDLSIEKLQEPTPTPDPTDPPVPTDVPDPVQSTVGLVNPSTALWSFRDRNESGWADIQFHFGYASGDWLPVVGDWNGDGTDGIGLYRNGVWLLRETSDGGAVDLVVNFGIAEAGWQPIAGDWDGDEIDGLGLYKQGTWLLRNDIQGSGWDTTISFERFGGSGKALAGDWNNDGFDSPGLFSQGAWALRQTNQPQSPVVSFQFGDSATPWQPVAGDWDTDGFDTVGIFHNGVWYLTNHTSTPEIDAFFTFGTGGIPVANYRGGMGGLMALSQPPAPVQPTATNTASPATATATPLPPTPTPTAEVTESASATPAPPTQTLTPLPTLTATPLPSATLLPSATPLPAEPSPEETAEVTEAPQD